MISIKIDNVKKAVIKTFNSEESFNLTCSILSSNDSTSIFNLAASNWRQTFDCLIEFIFYQNNKHLTSYWPDVIPSG